MTDERMTMEAHFSDDGLSRLCLRYQWDKGRPPVAWMMNNPSIAGRNGGTDGPTFDPTARRVIHFSKAMGAGSAIIVNWCPLVATKPDYLWKCIKAGDFTPALIRDNLAAIEAAARTAAFGVLACGPEGMRRHPGLMQRAVMAFAGGFPAGNMRCLGVTDDNAPLHPLARGKFAIKNDVVPRLWTPRESGWMA